MGQRFKCPVTTAVLCGRCQESHRSVYWMFSSLVIVLWAEAPLVIDTAPSTSDRNGLFSKGLDDFRSRSRIPLCQSGSRLQRVLFQWGPLSRARLSLSYIEGRVSGKRTRPRCLKSLEAQRWEKRLTTPSLQSAH